MLTKSYRLLVDKMALTPYNSWWDSPTSNMTSHNSGIDITYFRSSHSECLFLNTITDGSFLHLSEVKTASKMKIKKCFSQ